MYLALSLDESIIRFVVKDEGQGFDYENLPDPTSRRTLKNWGPRHLSNEDLSDEVDFKEDGRVVELSFYIMYNAIRHLFFCEDISPSPVIKKFTFMG